MKKARNVSVLAVVCLLALLVIGPARAQDLPDPDAAAIWKYITETSPYQKWGMWPDHAGLQEGRAPHGPFHKVFVNDVLLKATAAPVPYGGLEVKESYGPDKITLMAITLMYKSKGFDPDNGDWYWVKYSLDGKADMAGKVQGCISCHAGRVKNDYILVHDLK